MPRIRLITGIIDRGGRTSLNLAKIGMLVKSKIGGEPPKFCNFFLLRLLFLNPSKHERVASMKLNTKCLILAETLWAEGPAVYNFFL